MVGCFDLWRWMSWLLKVAHGFLRWLSLLMKVGVLAYMYDDVYPVIVGVFWRCNEVGCLSICWWVSWCMMVNTGVLACEGCVSTCNHGWLCLWGWVSQLVKVASPLVIMDDFTCEGGCLGFWNLSTWLVKVGVLVCKGCASTCNHGWLCLWIWVSWLVKIVDLAWEVRCFCFWSWVFWLMMVND